MFSSAYVRITNSFFLSFFLLVREDTLTDMVSCMTEKVGLVHQMPFACDRAGWPCTLEKVSGKKNEMLRIENIESSWSFDGAYFFFGPLPSVTVARFDMVFAT